MSTAQFPHNRYHEIQVWAWRDGQWHLVGRNIRTWTLRDYRRFYREYQDLINTFVVAAPQQ